MIIDNESIDKVLLDLPLPLTGNLKDNYTKICKLFEKKYAIPDFESIQTEICTCLTFGLNQASIMLTIHLLERFLLYFLVYHKGFSKKEEKKGLEIDEYFKDEVELFSKLYLKDKIEKAFENQLITVEQKQQLLHYNNGIRNPYSHANAKTIFSDSTVSSQIVSLTDQGFSTSNKKDLEIWKNPMIQGLMQAIIAESIAFPFFECVDNIIRESGEKIFNNVNTL